MRLTELSVRNLRSYRDATVRFGPGITLLSGDIGAGKSTLLHAVEFALFGLARGELAGVGLLRHGATDGEARLTFTLDDRAYTVARTLRRSRGSVTQDAGWFSVDGRRESLTAQELRARVFSILGYPLQFLQKQHNLVYRSTVYTPQEEMKAILTDAPEERVETIRRLFGLDAYRTARENAQLVAKAFKDREALAGEALARLDQEIAGIRERLARSQDVILQRAQLERSRREALAAQEAAVAERQAAEEERAHAVAERSASAMAARQRQALALQAQQHENALVGKRRALALTCQALDQARERLSGTPAVAEGEEALLAREAAARAALVTLRQEEGKLTHIIAECAHGPVVAAGTPCPTCQQVVSAEHLEGVRSALSSKSRAAATRLARVRAGIAAQEVARDTAAATRERAHAVALLTERIATLSASATSAEADIAQLEQAIARARESTAAPAVSDAELDSRVRAATGLVALVAERERLASAALVGAERSLARVDAAQDALVAERERLIPLEAERATLAGRRETDSLSRSWILQRFVPLTEVIERRALLAVHGALDASFRSLVAQLLEDDALSARLDLSFTPSLSQDGYETDAAFLSGGERTAVALAYRLALVRAVHALLPHLGTAGVVLLDEPTDGFSREQLERVTEVLRAIRMEQLVIVSHEELLEGFVDRVVRVARGPEGSVVGDQEFGEWRAKELEALDVKGRKVQKGKASPAAVDTGAVV